MALSEKVPERQASHPLKPPKFFSRVSRAVLVRKERIFSLISRFWKGKRLWAISGGLALVAACLTAIVLMVPFQPIKITFPDDPALFSHLLEYATVKEEFDGQGSGDILPAAAPYIPAVSLTTYIIQRGDTLSGIAGKHGLTVRTLIGYNSITDVYTLIPGTELQIPDTDGIPYRVQRGDTLGSIAESHSIGINDLLDANDLASVEIRPGDSLFIPGGTISNYEYKKALKTLFIYPAVGRFTSGFGYRPDPFTGVRRFHYAIDLANRTGTPVRASQDGVVVSVQNRSTGYGKSIVLRHFNGYQTLYAHLSEILVKRGEKVRQEQMIGKLGNTGRSTGPHLHFSIYKNNIPVNPLNYLHQ